VIDFDFLPILIPIVALMIPIVRILTKHQQTMAEIIHSRQGNSTDAQAAELAALRGEVRDLRNLVHSLTLQLDGRAVPFRTEEEGTQPLRQF
jgi:hypothetical protein